MIPIKRKVQKHSIEKQNGNPVKPSVVQQPHAITYFCLYSKCKICMIKICDLLSKTQTDL